MERPVLITGPAVDFITLAQAKDVIGYVDSDDDAQLTALIEAARAYLEGDDGILAVKMVNQTWSVAFSHFTVPAMRLPFLNVSSVVVKYFDADDVEQTLDAANYALHHDAGGSRIWFKPTFYAPSLAERPDAITVEMVVGYGATADAVPEPLRLAGKLLVAHWYLNPDLATPDKLHKTPLAFDSITASYKRQRV